MDSYLSTTFDVYSLHGFWERQLNRRHQKQGPNSVYYNLWLYTQPELKGGPADFVTSHHRQKVATYNKIVNTCEYWGAKLEK